MRVPHAHVSQPQYRQHENVERHPGNDRVLPSHECTCSNRYKKTEQVDDWYKKPLQEAAANAHHGSRDELALNLLAAAAAAAAAALIAAAAAAAMIAAAAAAALIAAAHAGKQTDVRVVPQHLGHVT